MSWLYLKKRTYFHCVISGTAEGARLIPYLPITSDTVFVLATDFLARVFGGIYLGGRKVTGSFRS